MTTITGGQFIAHLPKEAGDCVGILEFRGRIIIACQFGLFEYFPDPEYAARGRLVQITFTELKAGEDASVVVSAGGTHKVS